MHSSMSFVSRAVATARATLVVVVFMSAAAVITMGCSIRRRAVDTLADVLGQGELVYLRDEDPELVGQALPFNIKTIETLLESSPEHQQLLIAATKAISLYSYGYIEPEIGRLEHDDFDAAEAMRQRAKRLYQRAFRYGVRALEVSQPGIGSRLSQAPESLLDDELGIADVPLLVWTGAALGGAISIAKDDPELTADIAVVGALLGKALSIDESWDRGTTHEFLLAYEASRVGGSLTQARVHYDRALELGEGKQPAIWLSWAENVSLERQDRQQFVGLLEQVLAFDVNRHPDYRLFNTFAQRRAQAFLDRIDELFLEGAGSEDPDSCPAL